MTETWEKDKALARVLAEKVQAAGGRVYYVGGYVRDYLLGQENKDIDVEVHGIAPHVLECILDDMGERLSMGESFGIYSLKGTSIDIAMPRREKAIGGGHRDFETFVDPHIGAEGAAMRRDFTVNALMMDVLTGEIIDCFGGRRDLADHLLYHVNDESFAEDALRVLRGAQFAARFDFSVAEETVALCKKIDLSLLSKERVEGELKKALLKAEKPSIFFETLRRMEALSVWFPELLSLIGVEQNPLYHAEGDVWNHTMMVLDEAAKRREASSFPMGFMMTALVHDFGKAICTQVVDGKIISHNHETKGLPLIERFLRRITSETKLISYVLRLSAAHMKPNMLAGQGSSVKATNKMFDSVDVPRDLVLFAAADHAGRLITGEARSYDDFLYARLAIYEEIMSRPFVMGKDLVEAGLTPNARFSELLAFAHKLRLSGVPKEEALKQTLALARSKK